MADVRSKNPFELLNDDAELESEKESTAPTRAVEKPLPRHGKRDAPKEAPSAPRGGSTMRGRGPRVTGNEEAFRDRQAGSYNNRSRPPDEHGEEQRWAVRGRDDRGSHVRDDRHSRTGHVDSERQVAQGWGPIAGEAVFTDEQAGEAIAKADENEPQTPFEGEAAAAPEEKEPADKAKTLAEYLAEQAVKKRDDLGVKAARAPNEGIKLDKKWESAKELKRDEDDDQYIKGKEDKAKRERQRKEKNFLDVDMRFVEQPRGRGYGPRGRGGRGRGGGGRADGNRSDGNRSDGNRTDGNRVDSNRADGPWGGGYSNTPIVDEENFPSLSSK